MRSDKSSSRVPAHVRANSASLSAPQADRLSTSSAGTDMYEAKAGSGPSSLLAEYLSKEELAQQFGVCTRTIERWVRLRLIPPPVRLGRTRLYHMPTIREHLTAQHQPKNKRRQLP